MLQAPPWEAGLNTVGWLASLGVALAVLLWRHGGAAARAYGAFHIAIAVMALGSNLVRMEDTAEGKRAIVAVSIGFALAVIPLTALFLSVFPVDRPRWGTLRARVALTAITLIAIEVAYALTWERWTAWFGAVGYLAWLAVGVAPLAWLRQARHLGDGPVRETTLLISAFGLSVVLVDVVYQSLIAYPRPVTTPAFVTWSLSNITLFICAWAIAVYAGLRRALGPPERRRNDRLFALGSALGTLTALWAVVVHYGVSPERGYLTWEVAGTAACAFALLGFAFSVVRYRMFGLEIKVKWAIGRGTVAAAFVTAFFVASEGAQVVLQAHWGPVVGVLGAGALLFAIHPILRMAERVAEAALPGVKPLDRMTTTERSALYFDQARVAWADGSLSAKDRQILDVARTKLGISLDDAHRLERQAIEAASVKTSSPERPGVPEDVPWGRRS